MRFVGKTAVVTGAAHGIGRAIATRLMEEGAGVAALDRDEAGLRRAADGWEKHEDRHLLIACDVSDEPSVARAVARVLDWTPEPNVLANCAGINDSPAPVTATTTKQWDALLDTNLRGAFFVSRGLLPHMKTGAAIVHVASILGLVGVRSCAAYSASKGGLVALTRAMARDHAPDIRVNCVCPGAIDTDMFTAYLARTEDPDAERKRIQSHIPLGRIGTPDDVAAAVLFLAAAEASWITGQTLVVDGGDSA